METHGLNILVDPKDAGKQLRQPKGEDMLVRWIMERVEYWEQYRNTNYMQKWDEYYRIWRTEYSAEDKQRQVERSRIMPTDLAEAVETTVSELADAFFGREAWIDIDDNAEDQSKDDVKLMARKLRDDAQRNKLISEVKKAFQYGAVYGTGIVKAVVGTREDAKATELVDTFGRPVLGGATISDVPAVTAVAVSPREFVIDPGARSIDDASGCAHILESVPRHIVLDRQRKGVYLPGKVPEYNPHGMTPYDVELSASNRRETIRLVEYHGLVPANLMPGRRARQEVRQKITDNALDANVPMVEAIVLIANDELRLKAVENPFIPMRRSFFSYQHFTVPDSFYGRGVVEAGYHPYKALQTEIRARADGLALANYPTVWRDEASLTGDQVRGDPDEKIIEPGKEYLVSGNPNEVIREFKFSGPDSGSTLAINEYQKMIRHAVGSAGFTGSLLSGKGANVQQAAGNLQTFLRRMKSTAENIEQNLMSPLVETIAWRSMQYNPRRYPPLDFRFQAKGALAILQRDVERASLVEILQATPPESPAFPAIMKLIIESGPYAQRQELMAIMDSLIASSLNPPPPPRDLGGEARLLSAEQRIQEHKDEMALAFEKLKREDLDLLIRANAAQMKPDNPGH